jgi:hypothetical protein
MNETANDSGGAGPSHRSVEAGVAVVIAALGLISIIGSIKVGIGWGDEGPKAGFFPFYIGLIVIISSVVNLAQLFRSADDGEAFAAWSQIRQVVSVVIPTAIYVALIPYIGIYVSSALLIGSFMVWFGKYRLVVAIPIAILVPVLTFMMFEIWFLVPLPKGALENFLGY